VGWTRKCIPFGGMGFLEQMWEAVSNGGVWVEGWNRSVINAIIPWFLKS
jgi:hypothetical protein